MRATSFTPADALATLERRGLHFRRAGSRWLTTCPIHADSKPSLAVWQGRDGSAVVTCFPCDFNDTLPRFLCRMDGREPRGASWVEALRECGADVDSKDPRAGPRRPKVWPEYLRKERAEIPVAMSRDAAEMRAFIEHQAAAGIDPRSPYMGALVEALRWHEEREGRLAQ